MSAPEATLNRPDLDTTADKLRRYAHRWRSFARAKRANPAAAARRHLIAQAYLDAAELLEARQFKVELGAGIAGPATKKLAPKPKKLTRRERVLALVATGPIGVHDVALALGLTSRNAYEELTELHRRQEIARREIRADGRHRGPMQHLYYKP